MKANPVSWFEIYVEDMPRAKAFYEAVFDGKLTELSAPDSTDNTHMLAFSDDMNAYGATGALVKMEGCTAGGNSVLVYFNCEDCAVEATRVVPNGGSIVKEKFAIGEYGHIALVKDTEGNKVGLHSMQ